MMMRDYTEQDIHMALDGEMPAEDLVFYQAWLDADPEMKAKAERYAADREQMRQAFAGIPSERVPDRLARLVTDNAAAPSRRAPLWRMAAAAVIFLAGGLGGYFLGNTGWSPNSGTVAGNELAQEAIEAHVLYAAEKLHVVEVGADQSEHLLGWLSKRVGLELIAPDFSAEGLTFLGGRLLPAGPGKAAQFMYQDGSGNRVSLYVTADKNAGDTGFRLVQENGVSAYYWLDDGYGCVITGSMPDERLLSMANSAYKQLLNGLQS